MKAGSVIVDMAAEQGGNCELTEPGQAVVKHDVTIIGYTDLVSRLARQSSTLYSTNLFRLAEELCKTKDGIIDVNMEDEAIRGLTVIKEGDVTWPPPAPKPSAAQPPPAAAAKPVVAAKKSRPRQGQRTRLSDRRGLLFAAGALIFWFIGAGAPGLSSATSRSSCWPASSATWWCGMSRRPAYAADERHQCDQQHHCHRRTGADRATAEAGLSRPTTGYAGWPSAPSCWRRSTCSAASP
jgi:hypothetical protein